MRMKLKSSDLIILMAILVVLFSLNLFSLASATSGTATFYKPPYSRSACVGKRHVNGVMIAAVGKNMFNNGKACGKKLLVSCSGKATDGPRGCKGGHPSIEVEIGDLCDGCNGNHIDLTRDAFAKIAFLDAGVVKISFHPV